MLMQIFVFSYFDLPPMLLSDMMQSIFFMNEFFAAFVTFYNWVVVNMPCMINQIFIFYEFFTTLVANIFLLIVKNSQTISV